VAETVSDVAAFSTTGRAPKFIAWARFCASDCVNSPRSHLAVEGGEGRLGRLNDGASTPSVELDPRNWWKFSCATLSTAPSRPSRQRVVDHPLAGLVLRGLCAPDGATGHLGRPEHTAQLGGAVAGAVDAGSNTVLVA